MAARDALDWLWSLIPDQGLANSARGAYALRTGAPLPAAGAANAAALPLTIAAGLNRGMGGLAKSLWGAATAPGDVARGQASMADPDTQNRVMDLASMVSGGPLAGGAPEDAFAMGASSKGAGKAPKPFPKPGGVSWDPAATGGAGGWSGGKVMGQPMGNPPGYPDLYDFNDPALRQTPPVPQFDLPRFDPPKGVSQRVQDLINNPDVRQQMLQGMRAGQDVGERWYNNTQPAIQQAIDALGSDDAGRAAFARLQDFMGATSPRNPVPENIRAASYYYWREKNGLPPPATGDPIPQPYGGFAQKLHQQNVQKLSEGGAGYDPVNNPKPPSFAQGLQGNYQPVAVDAHAFKAPAMMAQDPRFLETSVEDSKGNVIATPKADYAAGNLTMADALKRPSFWQGKPNPNEYPAMEQYYKGLSSELGLAPAQGQASGWIGNGPLTGLKTDDAATWLHLWQDRINNTAMRMGQTPDQVARNFWQGKHPLLTGGGGPASMSPLLNEYWQNQGGQQPPQGGPIQDPNAWLMPGEQGA